VEKLKDTLGPKAEIKTINFNAYIHDKEEVVLSQICSFFGLESEKSTFESTCKALEDYFKFCENEEEMDIDSIDEITLKNLQKKKNHSKTLYIIFYENIEHLFNKQKQFLFYTLLEIVNNSKNVIFCGSTTNYNLTGLMEKRIRSRFSQKTFFLDMINKSVIEDTLKLIITFDEEGNLNSSLAPFYQIIKQNNHYNYYFEKSFSSGISVKQLFFNLKVFLSNIIFDVEKNFKKSANLTIEKQVLAKFVNSASEKLVTLNCSNLDFIYSKFIK
jgi:Cdc6-like AAA superfamily ATPase